MRSKSRDPVTIKRQPIDNFSELWWKSTKSQKVNPPNWSSSLQITVNDGTVRHKVTDPPSNWKLIFLSIFPSTWFSECKKKKKKVIYHRWNSYWCYSRILSYQAPQLFNQNCRNPFHHQTLHVFVSFLDGYYADFLTKIKILVLMNN